MRIDILTLFPTIAAAPLGESMIGKAQQRQLVTIQTHNLRDWARDKHRTTDDAPYGGSQGMVMKCEPIFAAIEELTGKSAQCSVLSAQSDTLDAPATDNSALATKHSALSTEHSTPRVILMSPGGRRFDQRIA